jgi:uncharacterized protein
MKIDDSFEVEASLEDTWSLLNDVPRVIPCMPGAELVEARGADEWLANLATKVGPMAMNFETEITRTRVDEAGHEVELAAKAREVKGRGRATATVTSSLASSGPSTKVTIETDLRLQGPVAQFGRGVVAEISAQMTRQFAESLSRELGQKSSNGAGGTGAADASTPAAAPAKPVNGLRLFFVALWRWFAGIFTGKRS